MAVPGSSVAEAETERAHAGPSAPRAYSMMRGALALLSTQPVTWIAGFASAALLPRFLGAAELGNLVVAGTVSSLVATIALVGLPDYLVRRIAMDHEHADEHAGAALVVVALICGLGVPLLAAAGLAAGLHHLYPVLFWVSLGGVVSGPLQQLQFATMRGLDRLGWVAWINAGTVVATTTAGLGVLALGGGLSTYLVATFGIQAAMSVLGWSVAGCRPSIRHLTRQTLVEFFRGGRPFLFWVVAVKIRGEFDRVLLRLLVPAAVVGWYAAANRVVSIPIFVPTLVSTPLFPLVSRQAALGGIQRQTVQRSLAAVCLLTMPLAAGIFAIAPAVPPLFGWPAEFDEAIPLMNVLALNLPLVGIDMVLGTVVMAARKETQWAWVGGAACVCNVLLNLLLIPLFQGLTGNGALGSALASAGTEGLMLTCALVLLPRGLLDRSDAWMAARTVLACAAMIVMVRLALPYSLGVAVPLGGIMFLAAAWLLRLVSPADAAVMRGAVLGRVQRRRLGVAL